MSARQLTAALIVSVALNLFLIAAGITFIALDAHRPRHRLPERPTLRAAALSLAPDQKTKFIALLEIEGDRVQGANRQARALRAAAWGSLAAARFDPLVAKADLARARALNQASRAQVENGVLDFAAALPTADRARFGAAMSRPPSVQDHPASCAKKPPAR